ncbi:Peptidoglycan/LPS O-acetylase OafA/YrhL, contains acyltransferase and SGNH-hydrolase domains [Granulicella pectinivorans]|uniref:Peptidoglycan/LPS O-acetylase OafA/YrhL, contains acyltransferase and SGNH-hydrolase domains n=2 Tax=Granulicella pectinivorans TaxID=474950 RepID=A0A1I6KZW3_9BACT|nr:Peptidoglycan/LPS O-acetylase OafA/YrhL, contains acyltransferase and SGNH-hydrolase domains [Granulicella pectinivorans]
MQPKVNLDVMRSFAIGLVVLDHVLLAQKVAVVGRWEPAWIGVAGVYMFFVHTCLVLMWSLERKPHTLDFYIRRGFRIYPLVLVALLFAVVLRAPVGGSPNDFFVAIHPDLQTILSNGTLTQNLFDRDNILGVLWSLPLEVDMYLLLPVLFFFVRRNFTLWPLLLFWALAAGLSFRMLEDGNQFATVIPCFLPGVMAYVLFRRVRPRAPGWLFPGFLLLLTVLFMMWPSVGASWPLCLALGIGLPFFHPINFGLVARVSHEIAKYSYGIYLSHPFALVFGFYVLAGRSLWMQLGVTIVAIAVLSVAAYHLLEKPMINLGAKLAAKAEKRYEQKHLDAYL